MYSVHTFGIQSSCFTVAYSTAKGVEQEKKIQQSCSSNVVIFSFFCFGTLLNWLCLGSFLYFSEICMGILYMCDGCIYSEGILVVVAHL